MEKQVLTKNTIYDSKLLKKEQDPALLYGRGDWYLTKKGFLARPSLDDLLTATREAVELVELFCGVEVCVRIVSARVVTTPSFRLRAGDYDFGEDRYSTRAQLELLMATEPKFSIMIHQKDDYAVHALLTWEREARSIDLDVQPARMAKLFSIGYRPRGLNRTSFRPATEAAMW